jgi:hypothetical protein
MDVDQLYDFPLEQFVPERTALARALRVAGDRDQATTVAALRKPSAAAWAVNQLVRTQRAAVDALVRAGDGLRDAQSDVLAGRGDARALRAAGERVRGAIDQLIATARGLLSSDGHELSSSTLERVSETLTAAALDDEARELVVAGRLERELRHVGLGGGTGVAAMPDRAPVKWRPAGPPAGKARAEAAQRGTNDRDARARAAARQLEQDRQQARAQEREARREVQRTERAVRGAEQRRDHAAEALREAQAALRQAQADAKAAAEGLARIGRAVTRP